GGDKAVQSGLMVGAAQIKDRPAIVDLPLGQGQVVMFATNPVYRWQNFGEYRMLYNALFSYKDLRTGLGGPPTIPDPNVKDDDKKDEGDAEKKAEGYLSHAHPRSCSCSQRTKRVHATNV